MFLKYEESISYDGSIYFFGDSVFGRNCFVCPDYEGHLERGRNMSNKVYDVLKYIAQIALPALGTLYFALSQIWGLPYGEQIVGTIAAVDACLGVLLGISTAIYNKGK